MPHASQIEPRRAALYGNFSHQTSLNQVAQIVINCRSGRARIYAVDGFEDLHRSGMPGLSYQERHNRIALRRAPQTALREGAFDRNRVHKPPV
jgi:hypothetical protein